MTQEENIMIRDDLLSWIIQKAAQRNPDTFAKWNQILGNNNMSTSLEVELIVDGVQLPVYAAFDDFTAVLDELIRAEAVLLLEEKLGSFMENIETLKEQILSMIDIKEDQNLSVISKVEVPDQDSDQIVKNGVFCETCSKIVDSTEISERHGDMHHFPTRPLTILEQINNVRLASSPGSNSPG